MNLNTKVICFILFLITFISVYFLKKILNKFNLFDYVNDRSSHTATNTRGGGISFVTTGTIFFLSQGIYYPIFCIPFAVIGFLDDKYKYSIKVRFLLQILF